MTAAQEAERLTLAGRAHRGEPLSVTEVATLLDIDRKDVFRAEESALAAFREADPRLAQFLEGGAA